MMLGPNLWPNLFRPPALSNPAFLLMSDTVLNQCNTPSHHWEHLLKKGKGSTDVSEISKGYYWAYLTWLLVVEKVKDKCYSPHIPPQSTWGASALPFVV